MNATARTCSDLRIGFTDWFDGPDLRMGPEVSAAVIQHEDSGADATIRCRFFAIRGMIDTTVALHAIPGDETALLLGLGGLGVRLRHP